MDTLNQKQLNDSISPKKENPPSDYSRGLKMKQTKYVPRWFQAPECFSRSETTYCKEGCNMASLKMMWK